MVGTRGPKIIGILSRPKSRRALLVSALVLQAIVLSIGWFATFRLVQRSFAGVVEDLVQQQNAEIAANVAKLLPETMGDVEFGSEQWERLQRIIEDEELSGLPAGGFVCLVEPSGRLLCHPEIRENPGLREFSFDGKELAESLGNRDQSVPLMQAGAVGMPSTGIVQFTSDFHFVGTQPVGDDGLRLLVHQPVGSVVNVGRESTRWVLVFAGIAAVGVLGISGLGLNALMNRFEGVQEQLNRQMREGLLVARRIQQAALPRELPTLAGYELAGESIPAEETGGDTFDFTRLAGGKAISMMIADATGHGIGPALAVSQLQAMAKLAWQHEPDHDVVRITDVLNQRMHENLPDGRFVTAWMGVLDAANGVVRMVSAGQDPQLVVRASTGRAERLTTDTVPLGILADLPQYAARSVTLEPGDLLLVATDGIAEASGPTGEQFGVDRMIEVAERLAASGPQAVVEGLLEAAERFTGGAEASDDRTVLALRRSPSAGT